MEVPEITFPAEKKKPLRIGNFEYFSAHDFSLTKEEMLKAEKELSETEEIKFRKIRKLREKLAKDDIKFRTDANYLLRFLRVRKFDTTRSYQCIKDVYMFKKKYPKFMDIPSNLETLMDLNINSYLPYTSEEGNIIFYLDFAKWKHQETSLAEVLQTISAISDIISMNPKLQINGSIGVWDMKELNAHQMADVINNIGIGALCFYFQTLFPWRVKNLFLVNSGRLCRMLFTMARPFISKKISERIVVLGSDMRELHEYINPVLLPKKLGGELEETQYNVTQNIMGNMSYLKYERSFT